jgi:hypothetical protein
VRFSLLHSQDGSQLCSLNPERDFDVQANAEPEQEGEWAAQRRPVEVDDSASPGSGSHSSLLTLYVVMRHRAI